jgi:hypothetical protein
VAEHLGNTTVASAKNYPGGIRHLTRPLPASLSAVLPLLALHNAVQSRLRMHLGRWPPHTISACFSGCSAVIVIILDVVMVKLQQEQRSDLTTAMMSLLAKHQEVSQSI